MAGSLVILFVGLFVGSVGYDLLNRFAPGFVGNGIVAYAVSVLVSTAAVFVFLVVGVRAADERRSDVARGLAGRASLAAVLLQVTFQALPLFVRFSSEVIAVQALGASALLLVWLYVMANVIVFGAEVNWWHAHRRRGNSRRPGLRSAGSDSSDDRRSGGATLRPHGRGGSSSRFHVVPELGDRARLARRDEDRVVAEALVAAALASRSSPSRMPVPRSSRAVRGERDELADVARAAIGCTVQLLSSCATPSSAHRADAIPGRPPSAAASIPESSPSIHAPGSPPHVRTAPWPARSRSTSRPSSSGNASAPSSSISQPGSAARSSSSLCAFPDASRAPSRAPLHGSTSSSFASISATRCRLRPARGAQDDVRSSGRPRTRQRSPDAPSSSIAGSSTRAACTLGSKPDRRAPPPPAGRAR